MPLSGTAGSREGALSIKPIQWSEPLVWEPVSSRPAAEILAGITDLLAELGTANGRRVIDTLLSRPGTPTPEHYALLRALAGITDDDYDREEG